MKKHIGGTRGNRYEHLLCGNVLTDCQYAYLLHLKTQARNDVRPAKVHSIKMRLIPLTLVVRLKKNFFLQI